MTVSCVQDLSPEMPAYGNDCAVFRLVRSDYAGQDVSPLGFAGGYDKVVHYITDKDGYVVLNVKSMYDADAGLIMAEGLHEGEYELLVLGIDGDERVDGTVIHEITHIGDEWLEFPESTDRPLEADYFYSRTPFSVKIARNADGSYREVAEVPDEIVQKRIIARIDFDLTFSNRYVGNALVSAKAFLDGTEFSRTFSGGGEYGGSACGDGLTVDLKDADRCRFMPAVSGTAFSGEVVLHTVNYLSEEVSQSYRFSIDAMEANRIHRVSTEVRHPDDRLATMYVTEKAMMEGDISYILQDDEPVSVYTDRKQRSFNTAEPLQVSVTEDGRLHIRYYSPVDIHGVRIRARLPETGSEYFDLAYFSRIPPFADFYEHIPLVGESMMVLTESGRFVEVESLSAGDFSDASFRIDSDDVHWQKIEQIEHGWTLYWGLFGGNPEKEDGGPVGNWMGIRPVHCRESVAFFLNFTYMIDMPEHEEILRANAEKLYDDNKEPVKVEDVLAKMRRNQTLQVGLVYTGNGVIGLGSPSVFGAYQRGWFEHYSNRYACSVMFHELGHVMGYGHASSFTYGPWAEELMNNFYVDNIGRMPVDGAGWLNSSNNPERYE